MSKAFVKLNYTSTSYYLLLLIIGVTILLIFQFRNVHIESHNIKVQFQTKTVDNQIVETSAPRKHYKINYPLDFITERLWFLTNGTLRPDEVIAQRLALWPDEGIESEDRIINQLMYVPIGYSPSVAKKKTIFLYADDFDWGISTGAMGSFMFEDCPVKSCQLVNNSMAPYADMIFMKVMQQIVN